MASRAARFKRAARGAETEETEEGWGGACGMAEFSIRASDYDALEAGASRAANADATGLSGRDRRAGRLERRVEKSYVQRDRRREVGEMNLGMIGVALFDHAGRAEADQGSLAALGLRHVDDEREVFNRLMPVVG